MADAARDNNRVTVMLGRNDDGSVGPILADHTTGYVLLALTPVASSGAVVPWLANSTGGAWVVIS